jgi:hypothetical protein
MPCKELIVSESEATFDMDGASAKRVFFGEWEDVLVDCPKPGDSLPAFPALRVKRVNLKGAGTPYDDGFGNGCWTHVYAYVDYTLEYRSCLLGDPPRVSYDYAAEVLNTGSGRLWDIAGTPIEPEDLPSSTLYPEVSITLSVAMLGPAVPWASLTDLAGKVNEEAYAVVSDGETLISVDAETLLFLGAGVEGQYDFGTSAWYYQIQYKFLWRPRSHNEIWRLAKRDVDADGNEMKYQDKDEAKANYSIDPALVGTCVYVSGTAGTAAWDTTTPKNYETGDFSALLPV